LLLLFYQVFVADGAEAVCAIVWEKPAAVATQRRLLFHLIRILIHFYFCKIQAKSLKTKWFFCLQDFIICY
jgi:hypothetical protein